ncbi:uncharacterized protein [Amphiura filiformis]|uniref:uncharacterized protein n=1 Tax=Amphiura filiformis TaxID=82378 RepID=UPI003B210457
MGNDLEEDSPSDNDDDNNDEQRSIQGPESGMNQAGPNASDDVSAQYNNNNGSLSTARVNTNPHQRTFSQSTCNITSLANHRERIPYTEVNKNAITDHFLNKPYHTRQQLDPEDAAAHQDVKASPIWKQEIDEDEEPSPLRKKVAYGEKRHLRAFLPVWVKLQELLNEGSDKLDEVMNDQEEEGILFFKGMTVQNGRYRDGNQYMVVGSPLGTGAFGKVYLCKDQATCFEFVVKIISLDHFNPDEALIWSEMNHPNVVRLLGVIRCGAKIYFFSEFVANRTLKSLVENGRVMGQGQALYHMEQLLHILKYVHGQQVVHKDLKPENVLVTAEGRLLLIDWGLSKIIRRGCLDSDQNPEGTQHYMSPEVAKSESYDFGADIWSTMCICIHLISGYPPWMRRCQNVPFLFFVIGEKSPPLEDIPENTNDEVKDLLVRGLTVDRVQRPSASQLLQHSAFNLTHVLQNVEAITPAQKQKQQMDLEMDKIASPPSEGEWRPPFAPADENTNVNLPSGPFCGLLTPEEPENLAIQDMFCPRGQMAPHLCDPSYQHDVDQPTSGLASPQQSDLQKTEMGSHAVAHDPTELLALYDDFAALNLGVEEEESSMASQGRNQATGQNGYNQNSIQMPKYLPKVPEPVSLPNMHKTTEKGHKKLSDMQQDRLDANPETDDLHPTQVVALSLPFHTNTSSNQEFILKKEPLSETTQNNQSSDPAETPDSPVTVPASLTNASATTTLPTYPDVEAITAAVPVTHAFATTALPSHSDLEVITAAFPITHASATTTLPSYSDVEVITAAVPVTHATTALPSHPDVEASTSAAEQDVKSHQQSYLEDEDPSYNSDVTTLSAGSFSHRLHHAASHHLTSRQNSYPEEHNISYGSILASIDSNEDLYGPSLSYRVKEDFNSAGAPSTEEVKVERHQETMSPEDVQLVPNSASSKEVEFCQWTETVTSTGASSKKVEILQQTEAIYEDSQSGLNADSTIEVETLHQIEEVTSDSRRVEDMESIHQVDMVTSTSATTTNFELRQHAEMPPTSTPAANVEHHQCMEMITSKMQMNPNSLQQEEPPAARANLNTCSENRGDEKTTISKISTDASTATKLARSNEDTGRSSSLQLLISNESIPPKQMPQEEPIRAATQPAFVENPPLSNMQMENPSGLEASSPAEPAQPVMLPEELPFGAFSLSRIIFPPFPEDSHNSPLRRTDVPSPPKMLREDQLVSGNPSSQPILPGTPPSQRRPDMHSPYPEKSSPPKMLREDQPISGSPSSQPVLPGTPPEPSSISSQMSSGVSFQGRSRRRKRPSIKLAPVFSEEVCPLPSCEPSATCDPPQTTHAKPQAKVSNINRPQDDSRNLPDVFASKLQLAAEPTPAKQGFGTHDTKRSSKEDELLADIGLQAHAQLSADPDAAKRSTACDSKGGDDIKHFLNDDEDMWRFQGLEGLSECVPDGATPTTHVRAPTTGGAPTSSEGGLYRPPSQLSLGKSASNADELDFEFMQLATNTLMHQASCVESPEHQMDLMHEAMDISWHMSQMSSLEKAGAYEIDRGEITSGVYTASTPHGPSPTYEVTDSIAQLQKQLSTISSNSSVSNSGTKVTVVVDDTNHIPIKMCRDRTIQDLAVGISGKVPDHIKTFMLQAEDGRPLRERQPIGSEELSLVLIPDPADDTWLWRVRRVDGTIEYPDTLPLKVP